MVQLITYRGER